MPTQKKMLRYIRLQRPDDQNVVAKKCSLTKNKNYLKPFNYYRNMLRYFAAVNFKFIVAAQQLSDIKYLLSVGGTAKISF